MVMNGTMMDGPVMPAQKGGGNIDDILIPKVLALPLELKQSLLDVITKMEPGASKAPVNPGLEDNLMGEGPMM